MQKYKRDKNVGKLFLIINSGSRFMGSLDYSLIRCNGHKIIHMQYNIDEISLCVW
jgi:hypothetical protein